jgi:hypothetical protein
MPGKVAEGIHGTRFHHIEDLAEGEYEQSLYNFRTIDFNYK